MRIVCISDTHGTFPELPDGDILVHTGDFSGGRFPIASIAAHGNWFADLLETKSYKRVLVVAGNHDVPFEREPSVARASLEVDGRITYLQDSGVEIDGVRFWGSPWQPEFFDWAFNLPRGEKLREKWDLIPDDTDVLLTHGPPHGILDLCPSMKDSTKNVHVGCQELRGRVDQVRPALHVFGHIHEGAGVYRGAETLYVNAARMTGSYTPANPIRTIDLIEGNAVVVA